MKKRKVVREFSDEMEKILQDNDDKGGWSESSTYYLLKRLDEEVKELKNALSSTGVGYLHPIDDILKEAIDVANFAMMIWDNHRRQP